MRTDEDSRRQTDRRPAAARETVGGPASLLATLRARFPARPAKRLKQLILDGLVSVDGVVERRPHAILVANARIELGRAPDKPAEAPLRVVYEDRDLVVIDKPANLLTTAARHEKDVTAYKLLNRMLRERPRHGKAAGSSVARGSRDKALIVHRLDYATSGLVVFAKNHLVQEALKTQFERHEVTRGYVGVAKPQPALEQGGPTFERDSGALIHFLTEDQHFRVRAHRREQPRSVKAETRFTVIARNAARGALLVRFELGTGKKNQIRAQMAASGAPIDGDRKYGRPPHLLARLALHADRLAFRHPRTGRALAFESPAPPEFLALFEAR